MTKRLTIGLSVFLHMNFLLEKHPSKTLEDNLVCYPDIHLVTLGTNDVIPISCLSQNPAG
jgi:hypothetical protein